jgi:uncharacterized repeat protein (TIGR01451 family)
LGLVLSGAAVLPGAAAQPAGLVKLQGHVPSVVAGLHAKGRLSATNEVQLAIGLPLRNREDLTNLLGQITDPASPNFRNYLTPEQFTSRFGPTEADYQAVKNFATANGLQVVGTHPNRMLLDVRGKANAVEKAFGVKLNIYRHPNENRDFYAPDTDPSVPAGLQVLDISGLDNFRKPHPQIKLKSAGVPVTANAPASAGSSAAPAVGSGPFGNFIGDDFRNAYVPGAPSLKGSGQTIALVQFDGYLASDIAQYETLAGRTNVPLQNILLDGFNGLPTGTGGEVEVSLDIEMVISMAPALQMVLVYEGNPFNFIPNDVLSRIATDNSARQISCSWGWTGGPTATTDQIFQQMAIQGQTFFTASGDGDAYPPGAVDSPFNFGTPADSAYLTSVGGTTLTMNGRGISYSSETVWNWGVEFGPFYDGIGSSGGYSSYYSIPAWQTNINMVARGGSATTRNFPDVALTADNVLVIADGGLEYIGVGGTSCAAPLWAGFTALINQQATNTGHAAMGFINPALYAIAASANYTNCFHDTTTGNNTWSGSPGQFFATNNYDLCTGLGTPNGTNLIGALITVASSIGTVITHYSPPLSPYGPTLADLNGSNPNGQWRLYVLDDTPLDAGAITNGWTLTLTTASILGQTADNQLLMSVSSASNLIGGNFTFTLTVTNFGPSVSSNVLVNDTLPTGVPMISSNVPPGTTLTRSGSQLFWNIGTLNTNAGSRLSFTVLPSSVGDYVNYAIVSADTPDSNPDDDAVSLPFTVFGPTADNRLSMTVLPATNAFAGNFSFTLAVTNYGPTASANVLVSNTLPPSVSLVSSNVPPGTTLTGNGAPLVWHIGALAANAGTQLSYVLHPTIVGNFVNYAIVSADTPDPILTNNAAFIPFVSVGSGPPLLSPSGSFTNGMFSFNIASAPGQTNVIQASTNLVDWVSIYTNVGPFIFTDTGTTNYLTRFYRDLITGP